MVLIRRRAATSAQEPGARQACYDLGCLPLVETELVADLLAADLDIEAAAAPVVDAPGSAGSPKPDREASRPSR